MNRKKKLDFTTIPGSVQLDGLTITSELIDPPMAKLYADTMVENQRGKKKKKINQFGGDMHRDKWFVGLDTIKVNEYGEVIDGQNRLQSCIDTGAPFRTWVVRGFTDEVMPAIDTGTSRSFADVCKMIGVEDPIVVSSVTKRAWLWHNKTYVMRSAQGPSFEELVTFLVDNKPLIHPAAARGRDITRAIGQIPPSIGGFFWYLCKLLQPDQADLFVNQLITNENLPTGSPIPPLTRQLTRPPQPMERKKRPDEILALMIHCWNAFRRDEPGRTRFQLTKVGELNNENFPMPV